MEKENRLSVSVSQALAKTEGLMSLVDKLTRERFNTLFNKAFSLICEGDNIKEEDFCTEIYSNEHEYFSKRTFYPNSKSKESTIRSLEMFKKLLIDNNDDEILYRMIGINYQLLGRIPDAIKYFNKAIEINPQYVRALRSRGHSKSELKDYKAALIDYNLALEFNPRFARIYLDIGSLYRSLKDYKLAIANYSKAIFIDRNYYSAYFNRGCVKSIVEDFYQAIEDFDKCVSIKDCDYKLYEKRAECKEKICDIEGAIDDMKKAIEIASPKVTPWLYMRIGQVIVRNLNDFKRASFYFETAMFIADNDTQKELKGCVRFFYSLNKCKDKIPNVYK